MLLLSSSLTRSALLRAVTAALAGISTQPYLAPARAAAAAPSTATALSTTAAAGPRAVAPPALSVLPMQRCGGAFCVEYMVDGSRLRAVVDTGSPFLLVDGSCGVGSSGGDLLTSAASAQWRANVAAAAASGRLTLSRYPWGCYAGGIVGAQGSLNDASEEGYVFVAQAAWQFLLSSADFLGFVGPAGTGGKTWGWSGGGGSCAFPASATAARRGAPAASAAPAATWRSSRSRSAWCGRTGAEAAPGPSTSGW